MKKSKIFLISFLTCLCLFVFLGACDKEKHVHNYESYVYKEATCTQEGIMEVVCTECGDKNYVEIPKHKFFGGVCSWCLTSNIVSSLNQGQNLGYTYEDIEEKIKGYGYNIASLLETIKNKSIKIAAKNGQLQISYSIGGRSYSFALKEKFVDFVIKEKDNNIVQSIMIKNNEFYRNNLYLTYNGGITSLVGDIDDIKSIIINKQNQFLVVYNDNSVVLFGKVAEGISNVMPDFLYMETGDTFSCLGFVDYNYEQKEIRIEPSHMGKIVDSIGIKAFSGNSSIEKVVLSDEIKKICEDAFYNCIKLTKITYKGTVEDWNKIDFGRDWNYNVPATEVICSNGTVKIN